MHDVRGNLSGCEEAIDRARGAGRDVEPHRKVDVVLSRRRLDLGFRLVEQDEAVPVERVVVRDLARAEAERIGRTAHSQAHQDAAALDPYLAYENPVSEENGRHRMGRAMLVPDRRELDECPTAAAAAH